MTGVGKTRHNEDDKFFLVFIPGESASPWLLNDTKISAITATNPELWSLEVPEVRTIKA